MTVKLAATLWVTAVFVVLMALGVSAKESLLRGHVTVNQGYTRWSPGAKAASDRFEALEHGYMQPGSDPMQNIVNGYVPPTMSPQQAAIIYSGLPNNVKTQHAPQLGTAEWTSKMAGESGDPLSGLLHGLGRKDVQAANEKMFEEYMRDGFGPVYIPPLHREHFRAAEAASLPAQHIIKDNQMSLIQPQYVCDGGNGTPCSIREMTNNSGVTQSAFSFDPYGRSAQIAGTGAVPDFGFAGMYVHQPSGLNLTPHRAYSQSLGRWLSRDPIQELTFKMTPKSPESPDPTNVRNSSTAGASTLAPLHGLTKDQVVGALVNRKVPMFSSYSANELNPYSYAANDPITLSDPSGLFCPNHPKGPPPPPPEDPEDEWNFCAKLCKDYTGGAWEECMYACLGGK